MVETFPPGHFYSPVPDCDELHQSRFIDTFTNTLTINTGEVFQFAEKVFSHGNELSNQIESGATGFKWCNGQFPPADALAYYGVLKVLKPGRVIEAGAGFSTLVAMAALESNGYGEITCIEPYPRKFLRANSHITLLEKKLQDIPDETFRALNSGDVLFIDSSHQAKCQSDVIDIFFRVLDLLEAGVFVHFHDIFYPDDYPHFWLQDKGFFFNEQYFLLAFLKDNAGYACRLPNAYLVRKHRKRYEDWVNGIHQANNDCFVNIDHKFIKGGSFWIEKLG